VRNLFSQPPNIDFFKIKKIGYIISFGLVFLSIVLFFTKGFNLGLDFTGGTSIQVKFKNKTDTAIIRNALKEVKLEDSLIQEVGKNKDEYEIRVSVNKGKSSDIVQKVKDALKKQYGDNFEIVKIDFIDATVGDELRKASIYSIIFVMLGIMAYLAYRFEPVFAIAAIIPEFHDVIITLGIFSLFGLELNLTVIAAILTVLGYSLNDTIIVFDRIRENIKIRGKKNIQEIINRSINENFARTVITSSTTLFATLSLLIFGGEALKGFAIALLIGIIFGTYSSIYVASVLIIEVENFLRRRVKE